MSSRVYAIANQKGGVGKTTTTMNLGAALAEMAKKDSSKPLMAAYEPPRSLPVDASALLEPAQKNRVLLLDLDQQANLTMYAGIQDPDEDLAEEETIYGVMASHADPRKDRVDINTTILQIQHKPNFALIPANGELGALDLELVNTMGRETILKQALDPIKHQWDYIFLDCPPDLSLVVVNVLAVSDTVLIPLQAEYLATRGVRRLLKIVDFVKERLNPGLTVGGILLTMADTRTLHTKDIIKATRDNFAGQIKVFETVIKTSVRLKEAPLSGTSILEYDPHGEAARSYRELAEEVLNA